MYIPGLISLNFHGKPIPKEIYENKYRRKNFCHGEKQTVISLYCKWSDALWPQKCCQTNRNLAAWNAQTSAKFHSKIFIISFGSCSCSRNLCTFPYFSGQFNPPSFSLAVSISRSFSLSLSTSAYVYFPLIYFHRTNLFLIDASFGTT